MADQLTLLVDAFSDVVLLRISHLLYRGVNILPNPQPTDEKFHQKVNLLGVCDLIHRLELTNSEYLLLKAILLFGNGRSWVLYIYILILGEAFHPYPIIPFKLITSQVEYFNCLRSNQNQPDLKPVDLILFRWIGLKTWKFRETLLDVLSLKEHTLRMEIQRILIHHLVILQSQEITTRSVDERHQNQSSSIVETRETIRWQNIYYRTIGKYSVIPKCD